MSEVLNYWRVGARVIGVARSGLSPLPSPIAGGIGEQDYEEETCERPIKKSNSLPVWGNEKTMNLNPLILTNIQSSQYFKVNLYQLKTYHEVIDEIYYQVNHLEPWEKGSRKTSGQTGMCGGVRGVGAGGIVSTAFCILYKLYTLKLTRKQVLGLINHTDSPYIRGLGFMYIRFTQPPGDLWDWLEPYLDDEEEIDVRAGGGQPTTIGAIVRHMLTKLEWHSTLFPRIPVPIQKDLEKKLAERGPPKPPSSDRYASARDYTEEERRREEPNGDYRRNRDHYEKDEREKREREKEERQREREYRDKERERHRDKHRDKERDKSREREKERSRERERDKYRDRERRSRDHDRHHHPSRSHHRDHRERSYSYELEKEKERVKRERRKSRSRSRSKDRSRRHRDYY